MVILQRHSRRLRATSYARRRRCSWSRSRHADESASTWVAESRKLRRAGPIYRLFSGVAEHGSDQPPHSEQLSQRRPWCDGNSGTFPNPGDAATRRNISTTVALRGEAHESVQSKLPEVELEQRFKKM
ncbi:uncharacterized protein LOC142769025 [Rhipicephalus microplus]|uniref:uncharacterized protein LOC142769025 n=1 Tax=Rhipicephalus microplus TaxID=6941 RepID=UPI003F6C78C0